MSTEKRSASEQLQEVMGRLGTPYTRDELRALTASGRLEIVLNALSESYLQTSLTHDGQVLPKDRRKIIHAFGAVAQFEYRPTQRASAYTGLLASGGLGVMRFSLGMEPSLDEFLPGVALKIFVDQRAPVNVLALHSLDHLGKETNFFKFDLTTNPPKPRSSLSPAGQLDALAQKALNGLKDGVDSLYFPLGRMASVSVDGTLEADCRAPHALTFRPVEAVKEWWDKVGPDDFRMKLARLPVGQVVYQVLAVENPGDAPTPEPIAELVLGSRPVASEFGDRGLFFKHDMLYEGCPV